MTWPSFDVRELAWAAGIVAPRHYKAKAWRHNWLCLAAKKSCKILNIPLQICQKWTQKLMLQSNSYIVLDPCNLHACSPPLDLTIKDVQRGGPAPFCPNGQSKPVLHCRPPRRKVNLEPISLKNINSATNSAILKLITTQWICFKSQKSGKFMKSVKIKSKWIMQTSSKVKSKQKAS